MKNIIKELKRIKSVEKLDMNPSLTLVETYSRGFMHTINDDITKFHKDPYPITDRKKHNGLTYTVKNLTDFIKTATQEDKNKYKDLLAIPDKTGTIAYILNKLISAWLYKNIESNNNPNIIIRTLSSEGIDIVGTTPQTTAMILLDPRYKEMSLGEAIEVYNNKDKDGKYYFPTNAKTIKECSDILVKEFKLVVELKETILKNHEMTAILNKLKEISMSIEKHKTNSNKGTQTTIIHMLDTIKAKLK